MSFIRVLLAVIPLSFWTVAASAQATSPVFPAGYDSWEHEQASCYSSSFISSVPKGEIVEGQPDWVYTYYVDGVNIAVVTYVGNTVVRLQVLKSGSWIKFEKPNSNLHTGLIQQAKEENGFVDKDLLSQCRTNLGRMSG